MSLKDKIEADMKEALRNKDKKRLTALRSIKSKILLKESEKAGYQLTEEDEIQLLNKEAKQRRESAEIYEQQGRTDLKEAEENELAVIESFLPEQLSEEELEEKLKEIISRVGAETQKDMGKVMGTATKELAGQADGKVIAEKVKSLLS